MKTFLTIFIGSSFFYFLSLAAEPQPVAETNEDSKVEFFYHYEVEAVDPNKITKFHEKRLSRNPKDDRNVPGVNSSQFDAYEMPIITETIGGNGKTISMVLAPVNTIRIGGIYPTPRLMCENVKKYRIYPKVPAGFEVYYRPEGGEEPFRPCAVMESDLLKGRAFEYTIIKTDEAGALPGKMILPDVNDGEVRFSLGFSTNGKSLGYISFLPTNQIVLPRIYHGNLPGEAVQSSISDNGELSNFRVAHFSDEVEIELIREGEEVKPVRVVTPQVIVRIQDDRVDHGDSFGEAQLHFYKPGQEDTPFVSYEFHFDYGIYPTHLTRQDWFTERPIDAEVSSLTEITRIEGDDMQTSFIESIDHYIMRAYGSIVEEFGLILSFEQAIATGEENDKPARRVKIQSAARNTEMESYNYIITDPFFPEKNPYYDYYYDYRAIVNWEKKMFKNAKNKIYTLAGKSSTMYEGAFPSFNETVEWIPHGEFRGGTYIYTSPTQKPSMISDGDLDMRTHFGYYRTGHENSPDPVELHDTHHGRMKWKINKDGSWTMFDYSRDLESLGQVTKVITPYLDQSIPSDRSLPEGDSIFGYNIATTNYTEDWLGRKRLPLEIIHTSNGQRVSHTKHVYVASSVEISAGNRQPVWITKTWTYPSSTTDGIDAEALYSESKIFEGEDVAGLLKGMPYSSQGADGSKESAAYHRGTVNDAGVFTVTSEGKGFRSVVFKGTAQAASEGILVDDYENFPIDPIYMIPFVSVAEVTIRNEYAHTVRTEILLFIGNNSWKLIDSADMRYDVAGNLIYRRKLDGTLYEAEYTLTGGALIYNEGLEEWEWIPPTEEETLDFGFATFTNNGIRQGKKQYERNEDGTIIKFYYDEQNRVSKTIRLAIPATDNTPAIPALNTYYTYDDENRVLSTTIGEEGGEQITTLKTYDRSGLVLSETTQGLSTTYHYTVVNGTLTKTTTTLPGGAVKIVENYLDGRIKSITGNAVIPEYYTYSVENGLTKTTKYIGSPDSPRYVTTYTDWAGREVRSEWPSSSGEGIVGSETEYNPLGQNIRSEVAPLAPTLYQYDGNGIMHRYGMDLDGDGQLGNTDRQHSFQYRYTNNGPAWNGYAADSSTWWDYSETYAYPDGSSAGVVQTRTWKRMCNFDAISPPTNVNGIAISETIAADANNNHAVTQTFVDRANGTLTQVTYAPFASQPAISVAVAGQLIRQISPAGVQVAYAYDELGRPIKAIDRTSTGYEGNNIVYEPGSTRISQVIDNLGVIQHRYQYDSAGRLMQDSTPRIGDDGSQTGLNHSYYRYNPRGQLTEVWGDVPYPVQYAYDSYGQRSSQTTYRTGSAWSAAAFPNTTGDTTTFSYQPSTGVLLSKTDPKGRTVHYQYSSIGQLLKRTWSRGLETQYTYDTATGVLSSASYSDDTPTLSYTYDRMGRIQTVQDAAGVRTITYRASDLKPEAEFLGRNGSRSGRHLFGNQRQLTWLYEQGSGRYIGTRLRRSFTVEYETTYQYDPASARLTHIQSLSGNYHYQYLDNSNLIASVSSGDCAQTRSYESNRNLLLSLHSSYYGRVAGYDYDNDPLGRRRTVTQSGLLYAPYRAADNEDPMQIFYRYNNRNELIAAQTKVGANPIPGRSFGYTFDPIGNRKTEVIDGVDHSYETNELNQYTERATPAWLPISGLANRPEGAQVAVNNQTLVDENWMHRYFYKTVPKTTPQQSALQATTLSANTSTENSGPQSLWSLARPTQELFSYDLDGNLLEDSLWSYRYDGENRLKAMYAKVADNEGRKLALRFKYDYMGRRVTKEVHEYTGTADAPTLGTHRKTLLYAYQGWTLIGEYESTQALPETIDESSVLPSLNLARRYTFGIDLSGSLGGAGDIGGLLSLEDLRPGKQATYHTAYDGSGNLVALINKQTGDLAAAYEYDPFGNVLRSSGDYGKENPFRFCGKYYDEETGLSYYGFRYYHVNLGRFINRDPLEERGGWTLYKNLNYSAANPYAGSSGTEGTSWLTNWEQAQDRLLENTSLPHTTQAVTFDTKKNSGLPGSSQQDSKKYSANSSGHYAQGGAPGQHPAPPRMANPNPAIGNLDLNLYIYAGNNPINAYDAMGLMGFGGWMDSIGAGLRTSLDSLNGVALAAYDLTIGYGATVGEAAGNIAGNYLGHVFAAMDGSGAAAGEMFSAQLQADGQAISQAVQEAGATLSTVVNAITTPEGRQDIAIGMGAIAGDTVSNHVSNVQNDPTQAVRDVSTLTLGAVSASGRVPSAGMISAGRGSAGAAMARGVASEGRVLKDMGLTKNTKKVSTEKGNSIPDALTKEKSVEIKDCKTVNNTKQLQIQTQAASNSGRESVLVTGEKTHISGNASKAFNEIILRKDLGPE